MVHSVFFPNKKTNKLFSFGLVLANFIKLFSYLGAHMKYFFYVFFLFSTLAYSQIKFDADFESGNLKSVTTTDSINYSVSTVSDIGGRWFYFRISGVKDKFISVTFPTTDVNRPMYSYNNRDFERFTEAESPTYNYFEKTFDYDTVYVAYYTPYTLSYLNERISEWKQSPYVESVDTIGFTSHDLPIQEIIITDPFTPSENKLSVWIHARTHPSETPSSFHFDGIVQELLKEDDVINYYRKNVVFHLIPFTNPDGVYYGRSRTNYDGVDVESNWSEDSLATTLEVKALKARMEELTSNKVFSVFLNLHSQASPSCTFWIHTAGSTTDNFYLKEYQFANINTSDNPYFSKSDYSESTLKNYFPEGWLWKNNGDQVMALTYETPYDHYTNNEWVANENLYQMGKRTVYSIGEYLRLDHPKHFIIDNTEAIVNGDYSADSTGLRFFGNNYYALPIGNGDIKAAYNSDNLISGNYDVYAWWPEGNSFGFSTKYSIKYGNSSEEIIKTQRTNGGQWNFLKNINLTNSGIISVEISNAIDGLAIADAVRIIYRGQATGVEESYQPDNFKLYQNYPNPFNPSTTIRFELQKSSQVELTVFNVLGQRVAQLVNQNLSAGTHEYLFSAEKYGLASGIYYYRLNSGNISLTKGMVYLK